MNQRQRDKWSRALYNALEHVQDAIKKLETEEVEEIDSYVMAAQQELKAVSEDISREQQMGDAAFLEDFAKTWFREADILQRFMRSIPEEPFLEEGAYRWRLREVELPPLQMPRDYDDFKDGPSAQVTVGSNSEYLVFELRVSESGKQR